MYIVDVLNSKSLTYQVLSLVLNLKLKVLVWVTAGRGNCSIIVTQIPSQLLTLARQHPYNIKIVPLKSKKQFLQYLKKFDNIFIERVSEKLVHIYTYQKPSSRIIKVIKYLNKIDRSVRLWVLPYYYVRIQYNDIWELSYVQGALLVKKQFRSSSRRIKETIKKLSGKILQETTSGVYFWVPNIQRFLKTVQN